MLRFVATCRSGVGVSIEASQALDPGSSPGCDIFFLRFVRYTPCASESSRPATRGPSRAHRVGSSRLFVTPMVFFVVERRAHNHNSWPDAMGFKLFSKRKKKQRQHGIDVSVLPGPTVGNAPPDAVPAESSSSSASGAASARAAAAPVVSGPRNPGPATRRQRRDASARGR